MSHNNEQQGLLLVIVAVFVIAALARKRLRPSTTAFGTASWASEKALKAAGMLGDIGLVLGRTMKGKMIRVPSYCHTLLVGGTGSGKGVSIIIPIDGKLRAVAYAYSFGRGANQWRDAICSMARRKKMQHDFGITRFAGCRLSAFRAENTGFRGPKIHYKAGRSSLL
jgi:Type IV secretory system Conjugative DNA transfer